MGCFLFRFGLPVDNPELCSKFVQHRLLHIGCRFVVHAGFFMHALGKGKAKGKMFTGKGTAAGGSPPRKKKITTPKWEEPGTIKFSVLLRAFGRQNPGHGRTRGGGGDIPPGGRLHEPSCPVRIPPPLSVKGGADGAPYTFSSFIASF